MSNKDKVSNTEVIADLKCPKSNESDWKWNPAFGKECKHCNPLSYNECKEFIIKKRGLALLCDIGYPRQSTLNQNGIKNVKDIASMSLEEWLEKASALPLYTDKSGLCLIYFHALSWTLDTVVFSTAPFCLGKDYLIVDFEYICGRGYDLYLIGHFV